MAEKVKDISADLETIDFVILSLIRELYNLKQHANSEDAERYQEQISRLQSDLKLADKEQLWQKVQKSYIPYLQKLLENKNV